MNEILKSCPKRGCGFSTTGRTEKQARARLLMHLQRDDHAAQLRTAVTRGL
ncbi:hypothetical protein FM104_13030 [Microbacterium esteraromaticum]|uniref:DUF1059 domain-containing protein n=1 Tax=Microbacterium esteraromaticum TaxID=57043 RepID=A0A1R4KIJ8_9MICO|nr:hypothetical protein [Microbacterium esteraromaticum]SJN43903.1 hypothetical protein FM104_13030 [Microbacterium esteraromaticum]